MNTVVKLRRRVPRHLAMILALGLILVGASDVGAQGAKQLSDKAVARIMSLAWQLMPGEIKGEDGKPVKIDRKNPKSAIIPPDAARRVIGVGRLSAHAQICDLRQLQVANYRTLMKNELASKKWSRKQIVYINQLHLFTVMLSLGNVNVRREGDKRVKPKATSRTCSEEDKVRVTASIEAFVKKGSNVSQAGTGTQSTGQTN